MRKLLSLLLLVVVAVAGFTAGQGEEDSSASVTVLPPGTFPIVDAPVTFDLLVGYQPASQSPDFDENPFTIWYEEQTNVAFQFDVVATDQMAERRNLVLASGDYPDVMMNMQLSIAQAYQLGGQGLVHDLGPAVDTQTVNLQDVLEAEPWVVGQMTAPSGGRYFLPWINSGCFHCEYSQRAYIYQPWLDALGLDTPTTTSEFRDALAAFVANDPNGNGEQDEIGLMGAATGWRTEIFGFLMNSFVYANAAVSDYLLVNESGRVEFAASTEEWQDGLRYLKALYDDGLIAPESFVQSSSQMKVFGENPDGAVVGAFVGGHLGIFADVSQPDGRWSDYVPLAPLAGPDGYRSAPHFPHQIAPHMVVFSQVEQPEIMVRWADFFYTFEGFMRGVKGLEEGDHYRVLPADTNLLGLTGRPALYEIFPDAPTAEGEANSPGWENSTVRYWSRDFFEGEVAGENPGMGPVLIAAAEAYSAYDTGEALPVVIFPPEAASEIGELESTIGESVKSFLARFVVGELDIDSDWGSYIRELQNLGVDRYVELFNEYKP